MLPEHFSTLSSPGGFGEGTCRAATPRAAIPQPHPAMNPCAQWLHASSPGALMGTKSASSCPEVPCSRLRTMPSTVHVCLSATTRLWCLAHAQLNPLSCLLAHHSVSLSFFFGFLPRMRPKGEGRNPLQSALLPSSVSIIFNIIPVEFIGATAWENDFTSGSFINF